MRPFRQRPRRLGQSQRQHQTARSQGQNRGAIPTTQLVQAIELVQALQRRKDLSRESVDWPKSIIQKPQIPSTSERLHDSNGPQDQDQNHRGFQDFDSMSMSPASQEPPDVWFCYIMAVENALAKIEKENENHSKANTLLLDQLESKLTALLAAVVAAVEDTAALTPIWDGMAEWDQKPQ